ncbi:MAG: glycerophosphodiester phosphodiesterase, partial [Acidobacteriota bacterium]|nr:glycerophosphodiester phosphodiesterase [Acidobacteriota bacterium]
MGRFLTMVAPFLRRRRRVSVVGHRGSRATHPENTIAAFEHAIACGADAVELDVVVTTDGQLAVTHDPVTVSFAELPASVPCLESVLELAPGSDVVFDVEAKVCGDLTPPADVYARMILDAAKKLADRIVVRSFDYDILRAVHKLQPEMPVAALTSRDTAGWVLICEETHARCISPRYDLITEDEVIRAHCFDLAVMPW